MVTRDIVQRLLNVINDTRRRVNTLESREYVLLNATQTLTNKTLTTPTIGDFTNAQHDHADAAGGGQLSLTTAVSGILSAANGGTGVNNDTRTLAINTNSGTLAFSGAGFTLTIPKTGTVPVGTGTAGRIAEWVTDANTVQASTLAKTGAGVLTLSAAAAYTLTIPKTGTVPIGTGTAGRIAEWVTDANTIQASTLAKTGAGVLTLSAAAAYTLTIPATGTAALLGTANVFTADQIVDVDSNAFVALMMLRNDNTGADAAVALDIRNSDGPFQLGRLGPSTTGWLGYGSASEAFFYAGQATNGLNIIAAKSTAIMRFFAGAPATSTPELSLVASAVRINTTTTKAALSIDQPSSTGATPTLYLRQADLSEEFIRFDSTVGTNNAINITALGTYYGRVRVHVEGVGAKWLALYD